MPADKTEIVNPIAKQAELAAEAALREKVDKIITGRIDSLLPVLGECFAAALDEHREPTVEEIADAIKLRGGEEAMAFSNDNKGQAWYIPNKIVPLVAVMAAGEDVEGQIALLRAYLFDQEYKLQLPKKQADKYLAKEVGETWGKPVEAA